MISILSQFFLTHLNFKSHGWVGYPAGSYLWVPSNFSANQIILINRQIFFPSQKIKKSISEISKICAYEMKILIPRFNFIRQTRFFFNVLGTKLWVIRGLFLMSHSPVSLTPMKSTFIHFFFLLRVICYKCDHFTRLFFYVKIPTIQKTR